MGSALVSVRTEGVIDASNELRPAFLSFGSPRLFRDVEHLAYLLGIRYSSADVSVAPSAPCVSRLESSRRSTAPDLPVVSAVLPSVRSRRSPVGRTRRAS